MGTGSDIEKQASNGVVAEKNACSYDQFKERYERKERLRSATLSCPDSQIWQCLDKSSGEECSIKVMKKTGKNDAAFLKEITILRECNGHPNLLHVRNVYQCSKFYYIVTDSLNHPNILQVVENLKTKEHKILGPEKVAVVIASLLNSLVYLHDSRNKSKNMKKRIVHGKIHPKNILIPNQDTSMLDNLMLVDFSNGKLALGVDRSTSMSSDDGDQDGSNSEEETPKKKKGKCPFQAPEYAKLGPSEKGDMWGLGVLTYLLLTGKYPFSKPSEMNKPIQNWHGVRDPKCREFIQALLQRNPKNRPRAKDINQANAWFNTTAEFDLYPADLGEVMYRLQALNKQHEFQVAVRSYISTTVLQKSDRARLDHIFRIADVNNDNTLSRKEFEKALLKADIDFLDKHAIDAYFRILDVDGDKKISYTEFLAFAEDQELLFEKKRLRAAFDAFDWSSSGHITVNDLKNFSLSAAGSTAFRSDTLLDEVTFERMIKRADKDGDGKISFEEFCEMMIGSEQ